MYVCFHFHVDYVSGEQKKNKRENENFIHRNCDEFIKDFRDFRKTNFLYFFFRMFVYEM